MNYIEAVDRNEYVDTIDLMIERANNLSRLAITAVRSPRAKHIKRYKEYRDSIEIDLDLDHFIKLCNQAIVASIIRKRG